jgi:hypothetical protein
MRAMWNCFPEGDQPKPVDNLWKELDGVLGCPGLLSGHQTRSSDEILWLKGQAALPQARETALPRESGPHAGPEHLKEGLDQVPNREPQ